jgi:hypothetical protein
MIFIEAEEVTTRNITTPKAERARFCLTDEDDLELAERGTGRGPSAASRETFGTTARNTDSLASG